MKLIEHLNALGTVTDDELASHFLERFGVNVKIEGDLYLFKYGQLEAKWLEPVTYECRGTILRKLSDGGWKVVSLPPKKFFNQHEGHCPVFSEKTFNEQVEHLAFSEKADGTAIQLYADNGTWRVSTLGTITPMRCGDSPWTFEELFWRVADEKYPKLRKWLEDSPNTNFTLFCELCSEENRIVTRYEDDRIYLLAIRYNETGEYFKYPDVVAEETGLRKPAFVPLQTVGVTTLEEAKAYVEQESKSDRYGNYPEGMVLVDMRTREPICKMKNELYLQLHRACGAGDTRCTRNRVIEAFFCGNMDDLYPVLIPSMQEFADKLRDWWIEKQVGLMKAAEQFKGKQFDSAKEYALFVMEKVEPVFAPFFFQNKQMDDEKASLRQVDGDDFALWMKNNYKKFETEMKALSGI